MVLLLMVSSFEQLYAFLLILQNALVILIVITCRFAAITLAAGMISSAKCDRSTAVVEHACQMLLLSQLSSLLMCHLSFWM
jgi:hypothetical protein